MSLGVGATGSQAVYNTQNSSASKKAEEKTSTTSNTSSKASSEAVVYEKGTTTENKATYSINKKSASDRAAIVEQMKNDMLNRQSQLSSLVQKMFSKQSGTSKLADLFSSDNLKNVSAADIAQAKEDVSEDGYWGVKQTSQRLFDFASALAGDDVEKMQKMQAAIEKGFKQATKAWGQELPGICKDTFDATNKLFDDYYASKNVSSTQE